MINYDLADILNRIVIGGIAYDKYVEIRITSFSKQLINLLYRHGFISSFFIRDENHFYVKLKYLRNKPLIRKFKLISTPGKRTFWGLNRMSLNYNANALNSFYIVSTPNGLMTSTECLLLYRSTGEILCKISIN